MLRNVKSRRYSEEQIVRLLGEIGSGRSVSEVRRLRELEAENARLRRIVAQQAMDLDALKELLRGKG